MKEYKRWDGVTVYEVEISDMVGRTFTDVRQVGDEELIFEDDMGTFTFYHSQDCCESVTINDVVGDLNDLIGSPMLRAEESEGESESDENNYGSCTWTFYKFATAKGYVDVRWYGESNGYYSESVYMKYEPKVQHGNA